MGPDSIGQMPTTTFPRARHEVQESSARARAAIEAQPTPERAVAVAAAGAFETGARTTGAAFVGAAEATHGPQIEAAVKAARQTGEAAIEVQKTARAGRDELVREVGAAWEEQPTIERKVVVSAYEVGENLIESAAKTGVAELGIVRAVAEGAVDVLARNPVNQLLVPWPITLGAAVASDPENGRQVMRHLGQTAEDIGASLEDLHMSRGESLQRIGDNVRRQWESQPTIERKLLAANAEVQLGVIEAGAREIQHQAKLGLEVGESIVNGAKTGFEVLSRTIGTWWNSLRHPR